MAFYPTCGFVFPLPMSCPNPRRNARERNRIHQVNDAYEILRKQIERAIKYKLKSRQEIVRHAIDYIRYLEELLKDGRDDVPSKSTTPGDNFGQTYMTNNTQMTLEPQLAHFNPHQSSFLMSPYSKTTELSNPDWMNIYDCHYQLMLSFSHDHLLPSQNIGLQADEFSNHHQQLEFVDTLPSVQFESLALNLSMQTSEPTSNQQNFCSNSFESLSEQEEFLNSLVK